MGKIKQLYTSVLTIVFVGLSFSSCDDFLDKMPDNRTQLDTPKKIKNLLVTSYPTANYSVICELSADNFFDNRSPNSAGIYYNINAYDRMDNYLYAWRDIETVDSESTDSPFAIWESSNITISSVNHALEAIETLEKEDQYKDDKTLKSSKGEALVLRAYAHYILVNIFCKTYKDDEISKKDQGVAYITKPVKDLKTKFERLSVAEVYSLIAKDLEEGIPLIDNDNYKTAPSYHFTREAAAAFAAKFYLAKRDYQKSLEYANIVLGAGDPSSLLRNWSKIYDNSDQQAYAYVDDQSPANLLILSTNSTFHRRFMNYRYGSIGTAQMGSFNDRGPTWNGRPPHLTGWIWTYKQDYGVFISKTKEFFEYTDKVARIGYTHVVRAEFTTDAALLDRAEAKIFLNDIDGAVADLQAWNKSHLVTTELTKKNITSFYTKGNKYFVFEFHNQELSPKFTVTAQQKPYVDCVLHFRRIERIFDGDRWFDIKRYGIELEHIVGPSAEKRYLTYDDDQRAIQIPSDVIGAGVTPNDRVPVKAPDRSLVPQLVIN